MSWWLNPVSQTGSSRFNPLGFDLQGVAPIGYTLFAVALGIFRRHVWQKVLPAMAATLAGFVGLRVAVTMLARPRYLPPETLAFPMQADVPQNNPYSGDWIQSQQIRDAAGNVVLDNAQAACPAGTTSCGPGLSGTDYNWLLYQPADRFWLFQGIETALSRPRRGADLCGGPADPPDRLTPECCAADASRSGVHFLRSAR